MSADFGRHMVLLLRPLHAGAHSNPQYGYSIIWSWPEDDLLVSLIANPDRFVFEICLTTRHKQYLWWPSEEPEIVPDIEFHP